MYTFVEIHCQFTTDHKHGQYGSLQEFWSSYGCIDKIPLQPRNWEIADRRCNRRTPSGCLSQHDLSGVFA
jgi:hypothetical protein